MRIGHRYAVVLGVLILCAPATAAAQTTEHTLSVIGRGQVELTPDRGSFTATVTRWASRPADARSEVNRRIRAIVRGVRALGVPRERIATTDISLDRVVRRAGKHGPRRIRFRGAASLAISVDGLKLLGRAIDVTSRRGATAIYGPRLSFTPALRAAGVRDAEAAALEDARTRAEAAAAAEGQRIVGIQSINLDPGEGDIGLLSLAAADSAGGGSTQTPTKIFAGRPRFARSLLPPFLPA